jgi:nucleoid-associated protein YgaU
VSERGLPIADGAHACPFVAFEDDRDERSTVPDHRHRCYAEVRPAPRALAHQEAYCLSSAFPVCPTFQDWARREAARARDATAAAAAAAASGPPDEPAPTGKRGMPVPPPPIVAGPGFDDDDLDASEPTGEPASEPERAAAWGGPSDASDGGFDAADGASDRAADDDPGPRRNPPRDWSAPPPWLASAEGGRAVPADPPDFLAGRSEPGRGLAGSAADQLAGGVPPRRPAPSFQAPPSAPLHREEPDGPGFEEQEPPRAPAAPRRPRAYDQHLGGPTSGPDWERPRRYEAYPTIKTRMGLPSIPRLAGMAAAVALAAVALFFLPALLGFGSADEPRATPSPSPSPSRSIAPTPTPAPTPVVYIIKSGDTLSKIAVANGLTIEQLLEANPEIKDPNKIVVGNSIIIPPPPPEVPDEFGGSAAPSAEPAP